MLLSSVSAAQENGLQSHFPELCANADTFRSGKGKNEALKTLVNCLDIVISCLENCSLSSHSL